MKKTGKSGSSDTIGTKLKANERLSKHKSYMAKKENVTMVSDGTKHRVQKRKRNAALSGEKVGGKLSETGMQVNPDLEKNLIGCFVDKFFEDTDGGLGLSEYSDPYFNILYKDGSVETLTRKQLSKLLVYDDDVKTRAERDAYPDYTLSGRCRNETSQNGKTATDEKNKSGSSDTIGTKLKANERLSKHKSYMAKKENVTMVSDGTKHRVQKRKRTAALSGEKVVVKEGETGMQVNPDVEKNLIGCFVDKFFEDTDGGLGLSRSIQIRVQYPVQRWALETLTRKQLSKLLVYDDDVKIAERDAYPDYTLSGRCRNETSQNGKTATDKKNKSGSSDTIGTNLNAGNRSKDAQ